MKQDDMKRLQLDIHQHLEGLRDAGQKEYAGGEDCFGNFNRIGHKMQTDRKKVLFTYFEKHMDGIVSAINGHMSQREPVYGRICDAIVYLELLYGMFLEDEKAAREQAEMAARGLTISRPMPVNDAPQSIQNSEGTLGIGNPPIGPHGSTLDQGRALSDVPLLRSLATPRTDEQMMAQEYGTGSPTPPPGYPATWSDA